MTTFEVRTIRHPAARREACAWLLPGADTDRLIRRILATTFSAGSPELYAIPTSPSSGEIGGLLVRRPDPGPVARPPLAFPLGELAPGILLPVDAELDPPVRPGEIRKALPWPLLLFHPHLGAIGFALVDRIPVENLILPPPRRPPRFRRPSPGVAEPRFAGILEKPVPLSGPPPGDERSSPSSTKRPFSPGSPSTSPPSSGIPGSDRPPPREEGMTIEDALRIVRNVVRGESGGPEKVKKSRLWSMVVNAAQVVADAGYVEEAVSVYRFLGEAWRAVGVMEKAGRLEEAARLCERVRATERAGDLWARCGRKEEAVRCWREAVQANLGRNSVERAAQILDSKLEDAEGAASLLEPEVLRMPGLFFAPFLQLMERHAWWSRLATVAIRIGDVARDAEIPVLLDRIEEALARPLGTVARYALSDLIRRFAARRFDTDPSREEIDRIEQAFRATAPEDPLLPLDLARHRERNLGPREDLESYVYRLVAEKMGVDRVCVRPDSRLIEDLGADSLDAVGILIDFEEALGIEIEEPEDFGTVRDFYLRVRRALGEGE